MRRSLLILLCFLTANCFASAELPVPNNYAVHFSKAYSLHPEIPRGILEAVAHTSSRFHHISHKPGDPESCIGIPMAYGVMALTLDGKDYFRNNLKLVADLSGVETRKIIDDPESNILAYASAYSSLIRQYRINSTDPREHVPVIMALSELPAGDLQNDFALSSHIYSVLSFLNKAENASAYNFPLYSLDLKVVFGEENLLIHSSPSVIVEEGRIHDNKGNNFRSSTTPFLASPDYAPALWNPTTCNYSSRNGTAISAVTIHDVEGSYAGCISWFKNCSAQASAHYVLRSSDGQVTQMVLESNKAWHVGSENPYTIGLEHEGYASQTGWYTTAMYNGSAGVVRDICASGYGINPLRTYHGPSCSGSCVLGSCVKIKGHQHYPNQTHVDPGPNWNWYTYYKLINPNPTITTLTTCTGTLYDSGGSGGNYGDDERYVKVISPSGATSVTLTFTSFNTEANYDYVYIYNGNSINAPLIGRYSGTTSPGTVTGTSGSITVEFRSDCATVAPGWAANWSCSATAVTPTNLQVTAPTCSNQTAAFSWTNSGTGWYLDISTDPTFATYSNQQISSVTSTTAPAGFSPAFSFASNTTYYWRIWNGSSHTSGPSFTTPNCDITDPTTSISVTGTWQTANFNAVFTDADNSGGSGLNKRFYQVLDNDGQQWRANGTKGFFNDNFNSTIHSDWTQQIGTWSITSGWLNMNDETQANSNIYAAVTQTSTNKYMYQWSANMTGTGTNRRSGLHFMIDNATTANRGNSYLVWWRVDQGKLEFYEIVNDVLNLMKTTLLTVNASQWYTYKVTYDPSTGTMDVFRDDVYIDSWTDPTPLTAGSYISLRNGNSNVYFDDVKVYKYRSGTTVPVTIGNSAADVRYQNNGAANASCRIKSVVTDNAMNMSATGSLDVNIDWTNPSAPATISDGTSSDIDTTYNSTQLSANWTASADAHSGIAKYWYAIGTTPGGTNITGWTNNSTSTSVTKTGLTLTVGQIYYFTVKAENGAGLQSTVLNSDGQLVQAVPPADAIAPTSTLSSAGTWKINDFTVSFTDSDNPGGSGMNDRYYQVMDYNGAEFRANGQKGFFNDNFGTAIHSDWTVPATYGTWSISTGRLNQTDEANGNSNIYASVVQNNSNKYMYHWQMNIGGTTGTNRRAGLHFFSDNPTLPNRGNSYLIWWRADQGKLEFYRVVNDTLSLRKTTLLTVPLNTWNDYKVFYDPATGKIDVYRDNQFIDTYTDPAPLQSGSSISLRNGNSNTLFDDVKVYHSRTSSALVTIGSSADEVRYQNPNPSTPACRINTISRDMAGNVSAVNNLNLNIDWTSPLAISAVTDGTGSDIDSVYTQGQLSASWSSSSDSHSGLTSYYYTIGASPGDTGVVGWTNNSTATAVTKTGLNLVHGTTYYFSVKALNGAGLYNNQVISDGQTFIAAPQAQFDAVNTTACTGEFVQFNDSSDNATAWSWTFNGGFPSTSTLQNPIVSYTPGTYDVTLVVTGPGGNDTLTRTNYITVNARPAAQFSTPDTNIYMPTPIATFVNSSQNGTTWFWDFGDGTSSTTSNPSHMYTSAGTYTVMLVAKNGNCPDDTLVLSNYVTVNTPIGVSELSNSTSLSVQPNPFTGQTIINYNLDKPGIASVKIIDVIGKEITLVPSAEHVSGEHKLVVDGEALQLSNGVYMIVLQTEHGNQSIRIIKN